MRKAFYLPRTRLSTPSSRISNADTGSLTGGRAYSLLYAVLLITSARLGDIYGPRNVFAVGIVIFTAASALSGLAQNPTQLIVARALQGLGAAVLAPQGLALMLSLFPADRRAGVFAIYGVMAGLAVIAGPTVGGLLVTR